MEAVGEIQLILTNVSYYKLSEDKLCKQDLLFLEKVILFASTYIHSSKFTNSDLHSGADSDSESDLNVEVRVYNL